MIFLHQNASERTEAMRSGGKCPTLMLLCKQCNGPQGVVNYLFNPRRLALEEQMPEGVEAPPPIAPEALQ